MRYSSPKERRAGDKSYSTEVSVEAGSLLHKAELWNVVEIAPHVFCCPTRPPGLLTAVINWGITSGKGGKSPSSPMNCLSNKSLT